MGYSRNDADTDSDPDSECSRRLQRRNVCGWSDDTAAVLDFTQFGLHPTEWQRHQGMESKAPPAGASDSCSAAE